MSEQSSAEKVSEIEQEGNDQHSENGACHTDQSCLDAQILSLESQLTDYRSIEAIKNELAKDLEQLNKEIDS